MRTAFFPSLLSPLSLHAEKLSAALHVSSIQPPPRLSWRWRRTWQSILTAPVCPSPSGLRSASARTSCARMEAAMAADTGEEQRRRGPGQPFQPGQSGNPNGRRPGARNRVSALALQLMDADAESVMLALIRAAKSGDVAAIKRCWNGWRRYPATVQCSSTCRQSKPPPIWARRWAPFCKRRPMAS
jgi:Family of unknown function (DUF5681)